MEGSFERMSLVEEDDDVTVLHVDNNGGQIMEDGLCLVGRFLSDKPIRSHIMKERLAGVWRPGKGVTIDEPEPGLFIFQFYHKIDLQRIFSGGPWSFDNYMLVLAVLEAGQRPEEVDLSRVNMWVQIHGLPAGFMSQAVGEHLGNHLGQFLEYDPNNNTGFWRSYMRIKVSIDASSPLKKEKKVRRAGGDAMVVQFKYERLGVFCFLCGIIGHIEQHCPKLFDLEQDDGSRGWGPELRVEARRSGGTGGSRWLVERGGRGTGRGRSSVTVRNTNPVTDADNGAYNDGTNNCAATHSLSNNVVVIASCNRQIRNIPIGGTSHSFVQPRDVTKVAHEPVLTYIGPSNGAELASLSDKKRRRDKPQAEEVERDCSMPDVVHIQQRDDTGSSNIQHFLLAGPGSQACQEQ